MQLVEEAGTGGKLAVFGAGNASDLELGWLVERFDEVHLIDLDGQALERARARHALKFPERLVLRGGIDLSGFLSELDAWGETFPEPAELGAAAVAAAGALVHELGTFDVTLSTCVLSQLGLPFRRAWVTSRTGWAHLSSAIMGVHLATLAGATRRAGILVCDVPTTQRAPGLDQFRERLPAELERFRQRAAARRRLHVEPRPAQPGGLARGARPTPFSRVAARARAVVVGFGGRASARLRAYLSAPQLSRATRLGDGLPSGTHAIESGVSSESADGRQTHANSRFR